MSTPTDPTAGEGNGHKTFAYGQRSYDGDACRDCSWQGLPGTGASHEAETRVPATPDAGDASEGLTEAEQEALNVAVDEAETCVCCGDDYGSKHIYAAVERIVAARESAAATRARAEALREAADEWGGTERVRLDTVARWLRARADSLAPDTAGEST